MSKDLPENETETPEAAPVPLHLGAFLEAHDWDQETYGVLCEAALRSKYQPPERFVFQSTRFPVGAKFKGVAKQGLCFVVRGMCRYRFHDVVLIRANQYAELPEGEYEFQVVGPMPLEILRVFEAPREKPKSPAALPPSE